MTIPVPIAESVAPTSDNWQLARQRAEDYLAALGMDAEQCRRLARAAIACAAADPAWPSQGATARTMVAVHQALTKNSNAQTIKTNTLMASSARARLRRWLVNSNVTGTLQMRSRNIEYFYLESMPPMQRTNMFAARIKRRPRMLSWLRRLLHFS